MAETFTVKAARNAGEKPNPHGGTLAKWYLKLADTAAGDEDVYCQKKPGFDITPGLEIYGRLEKDEYGWRLFPEQSPNGSQGGSSRSSGMSKDDYWNRKEERDVIAQARMGRAHSQEMAIRALTLYGGKWGNLQDLKGMIRRWTDEFQADLDVGSGSAVGERVQASPPAAASSAKGFTSDKQRNYAERLIEEAGASSETRDNIVWFMGEALPRQQVNEAMDGLVDGEQRRATALNLAEQAVAWRKAQTDVPADTAGLEEGTKALDDIPF